MTVRRMPAVLAVLTAVVAVLLGTAAPASAHAALLRTAPAEGSVVPSAPRQVRLDFSEGVLLAADAVRVLDPAGKRVDDGPPQHAGDNDSTAVVTLRTGLSTGTFTVAWKAVSQDSHPVAGAFTFSVGTPSATTVTLPGETGGGVAGALYGIARYAAYAGFALLVGACAFFAVCRPRGVPLRRLRGLATGGWAVVVAATLALLLLRGPYVNGDGLGDAFDLAVVRDVLETRPGTALVSRLLLLAASAVFLSLLFGTYARRDTPAERTGLPWGLAMGGSVLAAGLAATWAVSEHASAGIQPGVAMPVAMVHLLAMGVWLGGLVTLLATLHADAGSPAPRTRGTAGAVEDASGIGPQAVRRFSRMAFTAVVVLVATGVYQSWRALGSWDALVSTPYGRLLLVKLGLVALLVALASVSRRWTGRLAGPAAAAMRVPAPASPTPETAPPTGVSPSRSGSGNRASAILPAASAAASTASPADPRRAVQLARQQTARATVRARQARNADPARSGLRRSVRTEAGVAVVLLAVTTVLTATQPGRAVQEQRAAGATPATAARQQAANLDIGYDAGGPKGAGRIALSLDPARTGRNAMHLRVTGTDGRPVDVPQITVRMTLKARNIGPLDVPLRRLDTGHWASADVRVPMVGDWQLTVTVRTSAINQVTETRNAEIAP